MVDPLLIFSAIVMAVAIGSHLHSTWSPSPRIEWGPCDASITNDTSLACGFFEVPLDYHDASAGTARLAVVTASATGERRGSLFFNPGSRSPNLLYSVLLTVGYYRRTRPLRNSEARSEQGCARSHERRCVRRRELGLAWSRQSHHVSFPVLTICMASFPDIILRSPGEIRCFDSLQEYNAFFNGTIEFSGIDELGSFTNSVDIQHLLDQAADMQKKYDEVAKKCLSSSSRRYLKYIGAAAAVRDMVALADALDGPGAPVNYVGISYGTLIGSWLINSQYKVASEVSLLTIFDHSVS